MDAKRFDNWARNRALRISRRDALRLAGAGGASAALATPSLDVLAQGTCSLTIHGETDGGPSAPAAYDGTLQFTLGSDGAFTQASFTSSAGGAQTATGRATGRAIDFEVKLSGNQVMSFSGTGDQPFTSCQGAAAGILTGPQPGDLGAWQATGSGISAPSVPASSGRSAGGSTSTTGSGSNGSGSSSTTCQPGTEQCGTNCVPSCTNGQSLDLDTCSCPQPEAACIVNQQTCQNHGQCCSGYCGGGTCFDCAGIVCGDFGCVDPSKDSQNCGNCGNVCISPQVCANGVCGCAPDGTPCVTGAECCSQLCFVNTCTTCSNVTAGGGVPLTFCGQDICVILDTNIDHCGACFNACPRTSGGIVCDTGVCHDINSDPNYCGFGAEVCGPGKICHLGDCVNG